MFQKNLIYKIKIMTKNEGDTKKKAYAFWKKKL